MARFVNLENLSPLSSCPTFEEHVVSLKLKLMLIICLYSVIGNLSQLEGGGDVNLGWLIGRPIVASIAMAIVTPIVTKYLFAPIFRHFIEHHFARFDHISNIILMTLSLSAFITIAAYAGTSVLFGAFLAGTFLTYLPSKHPEGPFVVMSREEGEKFAHKSPTFVHTFERYLMDVQKYLMEPLFFASIGFAIPFVQLWTGKRIWRGIVYTLLMVFAKVRFLDITFVRLTHSLLAA
jgi:Kef-type K+ transport system membrane component KefB